MIYRHTIPLIKITWLILLFFLSCACKNRGSDWRKVDLGKFAITVPGKAEIIKIANIDSYVAKIRGNGFELMFDYGMYSPKMVLSLEEYLQEKAWREDADFNCLFSALEPEPVFDAVKKLDDSTYQAIYHIRGCLKSGDCFYSDSLYSRARMVVKDSILVYTFVIPSELTQYDFFITENDSIYKRMFISKAINTYKSGIHILNKKNCKDEYNCEAQFSLWTSDSVKIPRNELVRILKSVKLK